MTAPKKAARTFALLCLVACGRPNHHDASPVVVVTPEKVATPPAPPHVPAASRAPEDRASIDELAKIAPDPAPKQILLDTHYVVSNEDAPQTYARVLKGRGGAYVGVGAEQGFLFGGWARSDILYLLDFDDWVVHVNELYGVILQHAKTPDEVLELWSRERSADVLAWVDASVEDVAVRDQRKKVFREVLDSVHLRLSLLRRWLDKDNVPFFANDQRELDYVANLWRKGRVRAIRGDLTVKGALKAFGDLARRAAWPVRVLYLSNAEQYFSFEQNGYRDNIRSLPFDERSIVLHTVVVGRQNEYHYVWQSANEYAQWIGEVPNFGLMAKRAAFAERGRVVEGAYLLEKPPR